VIEHAPDHPGCNKDGMVLQSRLVMEDVLGRYLSGTEIVHHKDQNRRNNDPSNLEVHSRSTHCPLHADEDGREMSLPEDRVRKALQGRSTAEAADLLGVHHQTLRNRYSRLLNKRRSPNDPNAPETIEAVRRAAADPAIGYRELARSTGIASTLAKRICDVHGFPWRTKQTKCPGRPR
jgi:hypothetical protein